MSVNTLDLYLQSSNLLFLKLCWHIRFRPTNQQLIVKCSASNRLFCCMLRAVGEDSFLESITLKAVFVVCVLLLQKPLVHPDLRIILHLFNCICFFGMRTSLMIRRLKVKPSRFPPSKCSLLYMMLKWPKHFVINSSWEVALWSYFKFIINLKCDIFIRYSYFSSQ